MDNDTTPGATLGATVRAGRSAAGLSVRQLEAQSGVPRSTISRIENDEPAAVSPGAIVRLARALELHAGDLFGLAGIPVPTEPLSLPAMLRAEYDLPPDAIAEMQRQIERVARKYRAAQTQRKEK